MLSTHRQGEHFVRIGTRYHRQRYPRYWCWNVECTNKASIDRETVEMDFLRILGMMQPSEEALERLPEIAKKFWATRLNTLETDRRTLSERQARNKTLNRKILLQRVNGELSPEDFAALKETVEQEEEAIKTQQNSLVWCPSDNESMFRPSKGV